MYANKEAGSSMMEALIVMILIAILFNGAGFLSSRAIASHTDQQLLNIAITQMRTSIRTQDICTTAPIIELPNNITLTTTVQGCNTTMATINGQDIADIPTPPVLSITSDLLGGEVVVGGTWQE